MPPKQIFFCITTDFKSDQDGANPVNEDGSDARPASAATAASTNSPPSIGTSAASSADEPDQPRTRIIDRTTLKTSSTSSSSRRSTATHQGAIFKDQKQKRPAKDSLKRTSKKTPEQKKRVKRSDTGGDEAAFSNEEKKGENDSDDDHLERCFKCRKGGEVLECEFEGCELLWHVSCVDDLNGVVPEGRWVCPGPHDESCFICHGEGDVIVCDVKNCERMYHLDCLPHLKNVVPEGFWECPQCVAERTADRNTCVVCQKENIDRDGEQQKDSLVKCVACGEAVHLGCLSAYNTRAQITCSSCNFREMTIKRARKDTIIVQVTFKENVSVMDQARVVQIIQGKATGLTDAEAKAFLDHCIAVRK